MKMGKWGHENVKMGPVTIFSVLSTLKTQDPLSNTRTIWQTICMKQKTGRGMVSIIVPVIVACIALVGALLYATHEPGNPPFTFVRENAEKERMVESSPDAVSPVAEEKGAIAQKMPKPAVNPSPQPEGTWQGGCTSNSNPVFTHAFTDLSMIDALNPIGGIGGGSPGRSYIGVKEGMEAPVYAPVDAVLKTVIYVDRGAGRGEYGLFFEASCEVEILFDHIDENRRRDAPTRAHPRGRTFGVHQRNRTCADIRFPCDELRQKKLLHQPETVGMGTGAVRDVPLRLFHR